MKLWITRDKAGNVLRLWQGKVVKQGSAEYFNGKLFGTLNKELFPEITWENSPQEVEFKLIET